MLFLLDTNILVHGVRRDATWSRIKSVCNPLIAAPTPLISIVSCGELRALAEQRNWGGERRNQMTYLLGYFLRAGINDEVIDAYALIDTFSQRQGREMGKNDLWIAATAHVTGATLVTTDADYDHLDGKFLSRIFVDPDQT